MVPQLRWCVLRLGDCGWTGCSFRGAHPRKKAQCPPNRPMARGVISPTQALLLFAALIGLALLLVLQLNTLSIRISIIAAAVALVYPFTKRVTHLPQFVLGIAFSMGIPMSYAALQNNLPSEMWFLFAANYLWIVAYDTQYAMTDRKDDLVIGVKSTAILFGDYDNLIIGLLHLGSLMILGYIGYLNEFSTYYYLGLLAAGGFAMYQQYLCRHRQPDRCLKAFRNNNWFGAMVFTGIVLSLINSGS